MQKRHSPIELLIEIVLFALLLTISTVVFCSDTTLNYFSKIEYAKKYEEYVKKYSSEFNVDENLVYSIIKAESDFDQDALSSQGAVGLMQIMPETFLHDIKDALKIDGGVEVLYNPDINIRAGVYYLSYLLEHFGSSRTAIASYNAGIGNVSKWIKDGNIADFDGELMIDEIPFFETRVYVKKVEFYYKKYSELYPLTEDSGDEKPVADKYSTPKFIDEDEVLDYAKKYGSIFGVDPCLVLAICNIESSFNAHALSSSNAMGLMQIKPTTYLGDIRPKLGTSSDEKILYDAETNIMCGTYYLHWLYERLGGTEEVIVAYYYGIGNVLRMLIDEEYSTDGVTLIYEKIPNQSARNYLRRVLKSYNEYLACYADFNMK